jgi:hypothetical protein
MVTSRLWWAPRWLLALPVLGAVAASCSSTGTGLSDGGVYAVPDGGSAPSGKGDATKDGFASHDAGQSCGRRSDNPCGDGAKCAAATDCQSMLCTKGACTAPPISCTDGKQDGKETDVDCGGGVCPTCGTGKDCGKAADCASLVCTGGKCQAASPTDGVKNDSESDIDCGGALQSSGKANPASDGAQPCAPGSTCGIASDCQQGVCAAGKPALGDAGADAATPDAGSSGLYCQPASASDGVKNDSETDVDCGGALLADGDPNPASDGAPICTHGQTCLLGVDCDQGVCNANMDAGGGPFDCPSGSTCTCQLASFNDGVKNDSETDVDCGGGLSLGTDGAPPCAPGLQCSSGADCQSKICTTAGLCAAPSPTDLTRNDSETDVDCGGALLANGQPNPASDSAPACADDKGCTLDTDCLSSFCSLVSHTCVDGQSCKGLVTPAPILDIAGCNPPNVCPAGSTCDLTTLDCVDANGDVVGTPDPNGAGQNAGIDTCGVGEATDLTGQAHESCCRSLLAPGSTTWRVDKYEATSGRVRQFFEALHYDVRSWALAQFDASFHPITTAGTMLAAQLPINQPGVVTNTLNLLPSTNDTHVPLNAVIVTGALVMDTSGVQGCVTKAGIGGAATYWWDAPTLYAQATSPPRPFTQDYYDIKPMNCVPYYVAAAFCAWDGGRLQLHAEHKAVWGNNTYPWDAPTPAAAAFLPSPYAGTGAIGYPNNQKMYTLPKCGIPGSNGAVGCTVDWYNGAQATGDQGDFYYYPSFPDNLPNGAVPDTLSNTLDLSPYIAAPGRFFLDRTYANSTSYAGDEGWHDVGADMIEWDSASAFTGTQTFCDESGVLATGETDTCTGGVIRGTKLPEADILGGSWEGHQVIEQLSANWSFYRQYGKLGIRCARPAEP